MRYIGILFFGFIINFQSFAQIRETKKISTYEQLKINRQLFWDSLPKPINWTNDYENILTDEEETKLNNKIYAFEKETSVEIAVVTIDTILTSEDKFEDLSLHFLKTWGVGKKIKDNGILIAISKGYKKIRIQNGFGIEAILTDKETKEIIDNHFITFFRLGQYNKGIENGLREMMQTLRLKLSGKSLEVDTLNAFTINDIDMIVNIPKNWNKIEESKVNKLLKEFDNYAIENSPNQIDTTRKTSTLVFRDNKTNSLLSFDVTKYIEIFDGSIDTAYRDRVFTNLMSVKQLGNYELKKIEFNDIKIDNYAFQECIALFFLEKGSETFVARLISYNGLVKEHFVGIIFMETRLPFRESIVKLIKDTKFNKK